MKNNYKLNLELIEDGNLENVAIKVIKSLLNEAMNVYNSKEEDERTLNDHLNKMIFEMLLDETKLHNTAKNIVIKTVDEIKGILGVEFAEYANYLKNESSSIVKEKNETGKSLEEILEERKGSL